MKNLTLKILNGDIANKYQSSRKYFETNFRDLYNEVAKYVNKYNIDISISFKAHLYLYLKDITEIPICKTCGKILIYKGLRDGFGSYCSRQCSNSDPIIKEKIAENVKKTFQEKYGVNSPSQVKEIRDKQKDTCEKRYGNKITFLATPIKDKIEKTNEIKYGDKFYFNSNTFKSIQRAIFENKFNGWVTKNETVISKIKSTKEKIDITNTTKMFAKYNLPVLNYDRALGIVTCLCPKCNTSFEITKHLFHHRKIKNIELCTNCCPVRYTSSYQQEILTNFIKQYISNIETNTAILYDPETNAKKEIDIYLPDYKIGIEYNGFAFHHINNKVYHTNKTKLAEKMGIQLLHIYEDDWIYKQEIVKSIILSKLNIFENKIYARKCIIKEVDNKIKDAFLEQNHLQGKVIGDKIRIGLFYNNELVSLMTFGKSRKDKDSLEMFRFCSKLNTQIIGGASKLFAYYLRNHHDFSKDLYTEADLSYSNGFLYLGLGFTFLRRTIPNYFYIVNGIRESKEKYQFWKLKAKDLEGDSESEIMSNLEIDKIYNSGNLKFIYERKIN